MWKTQSLRKCSGRGRANLAQPTQRLRMVWRRKRKPAGRQQPNPLPHLWRRTPQTRRKSLAYGFTCALQKEILYQGKLFVSENWICFHSKVFGKDTKISIPAFSVTLIKKTKTALLVPNALIIATVTDRYIFVSLLSRDSTYKLLKSVCGHLENTSVGNSPNPSSAENSFRADRPSSLPLDFNDEFSDLDGVVQQRRQDMEGYSSSGSQTPESENSRVDFHVTESQTVLNVSKGEAKPTRADAHVNRVPEGKAKSLPVQGLSETVGILHKVKSQKCPMLHHILIFYAIVVCALIISTFYMRYRINTLEEQLGLLTSIVDTHNTEYKITYRSCLRMVTDRPDCSGHRNTSCFPLKKVLPEAFCLSAPCWSEAQADENPDIACGGLQLRKVGREIILVLVQ
ncbi:GRAM domain-containing protein 2B isoform X16 [Pan troglodytes]|uniref:GRAM domain-containing protein 2B isoform X16 n=1 Tax=Pan troglodytes TaxID=9598 RepID=UPI000511D49B|nr:GRAM domain-containing protein 2B isoform X15 [Pan troglodytes]